MVGKRALAIFIGLLLIGLTSCQKVKVDEHSVSIGILLNDKCMHDRQDLELMQARADEIGFQVMTGQSEGDSYQQFLEAKRLIEQGVDILIINPINTKTSPALGHLCEKNQVKLIGYKKMLEFTQLDLCLTYDYQKVGQMQVTEILKDKVGGSIAILAGPSNDYSSFRIREGNLEAIQALSTKRKINLIYDEWADELSAEEGFRMAENLFKIYQHTDIIITHHPNLAEGISKYLYNHGLTAEVSLVGALADNHSLERIKIDRQELSIHLPRKEMAYTAIDLADRLGKELPLDNTISYTNNGKIEVPTVIFNVMTVRK